MPAMQLDLSDSNYKALQHSAQWARKRHEQVDIVGPCPYPTAPSVHSFIHSLDFKVLGPTDQ